MDCTMRPKNGSAKNRSPDSKITRAIESVRWVTSVRAARLGTYPSSAIASSTAALALGLTCADPLTTRDTVPRPTPARSATWSRVGRPVDRDRSVVTRSSPSAFPVMLASHNLPCGFTRTPVGGWWTVAPGTGSG
jgi:hypothetical protein